MSYILRVIALDPCIESGSNDKDKLFQVRIASFTRVPVHPPRTHSTRVPDLPILLQSCFQFVKSTHD